MKYFLDLEIARSSTGIMFSQQQYTLQLLEDMSFLASKPTVVSMDPKLQLNATNGDLLDDAFQYRRLMGHFLYLTLSRPDITFAVHKLSQFLAKPRQPHLKATIIFFIISSSPLVKVCCFLLPLLCNCRLF